MDILFLTLNRTDACSFYRSGGIAKDLRHQSGHDIAVIQWSDIPMHWQNISDFDIIMMQRPASKHARDLCKHIKQMNVPLWLDYDDNFFCVPPENKASRIYDNVDTRKAVEEILGMGDVVSVTTEDLKRSYGRYNKNIVVIPNAFNDIILRRGLLRKRADLVTWRGTDTHIYDVMSYGSAINKVTEEYPDSRFLFLGFFPWFLKETKNKFFLDDMDVILYFKTVLAMAPSVMQVPLIDSLFNRCKSNIAYIESAFFGSVPVVPDWWDHPGALTYKNPKEYYIAIDSVLKGEVDITATNKLAWEFVCDTLTLSKVNKLRVDLINSLL